MKRCQKSLRAVSLKINSLNSVLTFKMSKKDEIQLGYHAKTSKCLIFIPTSNIPADNYRILKLQVVMQSEQNLMSNRHKNISLVADEPCEISVRIFYIGWRGNDYGRNKSWLRVEVLIYKAGHSSSHNHNSRDNKLLHPIKLHKMIQTRNNLCLMMNTNVFWCSRCHR